MAEQHNGRSGTLMFAIGEAVVVHAWHIDVQRGVLTKWNGLLTVKAFAGMLTDEVATVTLVDAGTPRKTLSGAIVVTRIVPPKGPMMDCRFEGVGELKMRYRST